MTLLEQWEIRPVRLYGLPAPKGSMVPGQRRDGSLFVREDNRGTKRWRAQIAKAGLLLRQEAGGTITGPVGVDVTLTVPRPPSTDRAWPHAKANRAGLGGDVDKLARTVLDGLEDSGLFANDAQVCELTARKVYPCPPVIHPDGLDRPGALIRIYPL